MATTVVGVYNAKDEAQQVLEELVSSGFSREDVQITSGSDSDAGKEAGGGKRGHPAEQAISLFFESMFGVADPSREVNRYTQAARGGKFVVTANAVDDDEIERAQDIMAQYNPIDLEDESPDVDESKGPRQAKRSTSTEAETTKAKGGSRSKEQGSVEEETTFAVTQEELEVGKREVQRGGVRVFRRTSETPVEESVKLREERVKVERRPVDRPASEAELEGGFEEDAIELRETEEQAVVKKTARVVEEVVVGKEVTDRTETIKDTVRRSDVEVEELDAEQARPSARNKEKRK